VRELELARAAQLSSGKPPRYNGRCRALPPGQRAARLAAGDSATLRFAVPDSGVVEFTDLVHGPRSFLCADIGDFVLQRADGTASFFFSNAVDDSLSNVTQVLRGDDHLTNTPRQLLILSALAMPAPQYGHLALLTGASGAPLSKRAGDASLRGLQTEGFLPEALCNHLFRLGHSTPVPGVLDFDAMAAAFDTGHLQRAPAHFDSTQLMTWQRESVHRLSLPAAENWLSSRLPPTLVGDQRGYFIQAVLPNLLRPDDVLPWIDIVLQDQPAIDAEAATILASADRRLFSAAAAAAADNDFGRISAAAREATGLRGPALFKPLRAALTGRLSGPELAPLLRAMAPGAAQQRLTRFA
jgi:glutamyl/glutaminyl-tRNA synthetase